MLSLVRRTLVQRLLPQLLGGQPSPRGQRLYSNQARQIRLAEARSYEINMDFSWVPCDAAGRRKPISYLTDVSKSPDEVLAGLSDFDRRRLREIREQIVIQVALGMAKVPDPDKLTSHDWLQLLGCTSVNSLGKKFYYLGIKQHSEARGLEKRAQKAAMRLQAEQVATEEKSFSWSRFLARVEGPEINAFYNLRLLHEYEFCPSLVFDMAFDDRMPARGLTDCAYQLSEIFYYNRSVVEPFQLHFCNLRRDTQQYYQLYKLLSDQKQTESYSGEFRGIEDLWPYRFTSDCYSNLFPTRDLVYLSPDARQELRVYDPTKVYIIGGLVDLRGNEVGLTKSKAAKQGISSYRVPRSVTNRSLPLNIIFTMLHDLRTTGSWHAAAARLPRRHSMTHQGDTGRLLLKRDSANPDQL